MWDLTVGFSSSLCSKFHIVHNQNLIQIDLCDSVIRDGTGRGECDNLTGTHPCGDVQHCEEDQFPHSHRGGNDPVGHHSVAGCGFPEAPVLYVGFRVSMRT